MRLKTLATIGLAAILAAAPVQTARSETPKKEVSLTEVCKDYKPHVPVPEALEHFKKAHQCKEAANLECAVSEYQKAIEIDPSYDEAMNDLGVVYRTNEELEKAIAIYEKVIKLNPCNSKVYSNMGTAYFGLGQKTKEKENFNLAITFFEKCLELDPSNKYAEGAIRVIKSKYLR